MAKTITLTEDTYISGVYRASGYSASVADDIAANLVAAGLATCSALDPVDTVRDLKLTDGADKVCGVATLVTGVKVVSNVRVTANSRIFLTVQSLGTVAAPKAIAVTARTAGTSFTITSADATDTSVVAWMIVEPV